MCYASKKNLRICIVSKKNLRICKTLFIADSCVSKKKSLTVFFSYEQEVKETLKASRWWKLLTKGSKICKKKIKKHTQCCYHLNLVQRGEFLMEEICSVFCIFHKKCTPKSQHMYNFKPRTPLYSVDTTKKAKEKNHPKQGVTSQGIRQAAKPYVYVAAICG